MKLLTDFRQYIKDNNLLVKGDSLLLGVSGGPDSLTMLDLFVRIKTEFDLELIVFHLNHMFRKEAKLEAEFVTKVTNNYGLKVIVEEYNVPALIKETHLSPEEAARQVRFSLMKKKLEEMGIKKLALAHNKDDLVETILLNIFRGTGLKGLTGIQAIRPFNTMFLIHPLLFAYRHEIEAYCQKQGLKAKYDPSNQEKIYTRNKLRLELIPYIEKEINAGIKDNLTRMAKIIKAEEDYLNKLAQKKYQELLIKKEKEKIILSLPGLKELNVVIRQRVIQQVISDLKGDNLDIYYTNYQVINSLIRDSTTGKKLELPSGLKVKLVYDHFIIKKGDFKEEKTKFTVKLTVPGQVKLAGEAKITAELLDYFPEWYLQAKSPELCLLDANKVKLPLLVRNRRAGDRFCPLGMKGEKKLKDFFIDEKIPRQQREQIPVVEDNAGKIIWLANLRMDERVKISKETKKILRLCYKNNED